MPGIEICRAFFIHTKKNYFRSSVSEENHMKNSYFVYFLLIISCSPAMTKNPVQPA